MECKWGPCDLTFPTSLGILTLAFAFVSLTIIKSHRPHLPSLSISARLFCLGNARIELPAEETILDMSF